MRVLRELPRDVWWEVARKCEYATFFHTPLWHELAEHTYPHYRDLSIGVELEHGTTAVVPLLRVRGIGPLRDLYSSFEMCYGGLIADGPISLTDVQRVYNAACNWPVLRLQLNGNPLARHADPARNFTVEGDVTHILRLKSSFETVFAGFSKGHQQNYRKGLRRGVEVRLAESIEDYRAYYAVYEDSVRRWLEKGLHIAGKLYPWELFAHGFALSQTYPETIKLWLAYLDGKVISGAWIFYWNRHVVYWHGATYEEYFDYRPSIVVHTEAIRDAVERGYSYYDFNPSGGLEGVLEFKRRFGTEETSFIRWKYGDAKFVLVRQARDLAGSMLNRFRSSMPIKAGDLTTK